jgi:hypothetical protein
MALTATTGSGVQATTQSPQAATSQSGGGPSTQSSSSVQPGTATSLLTSNNGVSLHGTALTTVTLGTSAAATPSTIAATQVPLARPQVHHINPVLLGGSGLLLVIAVVSFWLTSRSAKNSTKNYY